MAHPNIWVRLGLVIFLLCIGFSTGAGTLWGAEKYGEMTVEKGSITLIRGGHLLRFDGAEKRIPLMALDLIRVKRDGLVTVYAPGQVILKLGNNAVFHVAKWERSNKGGFFRTLFGRVSVSVKSLLGGEPFNVSSSTAVIGVKGTEYIAAVTPEGNTILIGKESQVELGGLVGMAQEVNPGQVSLVLVGKASTQPAPVPAKVIEIFDSDNLDAPLPMSSAASEFPGEAALVEAGIVSQADLNEAKKSRSNRGEDDDDLNLPALEPEILSDLGDDLQATAEEITEGIYLNINFQP